MPDVADIDAFNAQPWMMRLVSAMGFADVVHERRCARPDHAKPTHPRIATLKLEADYDVFAWCDGCNGLLYVAGRN